MSNPRGGPGDLQHNYQPRPAGWRSSQGSQPKNWLLGRSHSTGITLIKNIFCRKELFNNTLFHYVNKNLYEEELTDLQKLQRKLKIRNHRDDYLSNLENYTIYFDHKIADEVSSFPYIYLRKYYFLYGT